MKLKIPLESLKPLLINIISPYLALKAVYPEHSWEEISFKRPPNYWAAIKNQQQFFDDLAKKLSILYHPSVDVPQTLILKKSGIK